MSDITSLVRSIVAAEVASQYSANLQMRTLENESLTLPAPVPQAQATPVVPLALAATPVVETQVQVPVPLQTQQVQEAAPIQASTNPSNPSGGNMWEILKPIVGAAFTKEQQLWLSHPNNLLALPGFLMTAEGRHVLIKTLEAYQYFVSGGNPPSTPVAPPSAAPSVPVNPAGPSH
jgi:hypothetical protein